VPDEQRKTPARRPENGRGRPPAAAVPETERFDAPPLVVASGGRFFLPALVSEFENPDSQTFRHGQAGHIIDAPG